MVAVFVFITLASLYLMNYTSLMIFLDFCQIVGGLVFLHIPHSLFNYQILKSFYYTNFDALIPRLSEFKKDYYGNSTVLYLT